MAIIKIMEGEKMNNRFILFLFSLFLLIGTSASVNATIVTYTDFSDLSGFTLNGVTNTLNTGGTGVTAADGSKVLRLTNDYSQSGSAFLTNSILLEDNNGFQASFSTAFDFQISNPLSGGADGIVFVVQTEANTAGGGGGGIGYIGIDNSVGIEFDNWYNGAQDGVYDISTNHVGINLNGSVNSVIDENVSPDFDNGGIWHAWVDYNGASDLLEVRLSTVATRPTSALLSYTVDLVSVLGQSSAFIGFTSGTASAAAYHDIRAWQFTNTLNPIDDIIDPPVTVPVPGTLLLLGSGLLGIASINRRRKQ